MLSKRCSSDVYKFGLKTIFNCIKSHFCQLLTLLSQDASFYCENAHSIFSSKNPLNVL